MQINECNSAFGVSFMQADTLNCDILSYCIDYLFYFHLNNWRELTQSFLYLIQYEKYIYFWNVYLVSLHANVNVNASEIDTILTSHVKKRSFLRESIKFLSLKNKIIFCYLFLSISKTYWMNVTSFEIT